jgi:hypothetical protein
MAKSNESYLAEVNALFGGKEELSELSGGVQREDPPRMVNSWKKRAIERIKRDEEKIVAVLTHDMDRKPKSVKLVRNRKEEEDTDVYFDLKVNGKVIGGISAGYPHDDWSFGPEDSMKSYGKLDKPYEAILKAATKTIGYKTRSRGYDEVPVKEDKDSLMEADGTAASIKALRDTDYRDSSAYFRMVQLLKGLAAVAEDDKTANKFLSAVSDALTSAARKVLPGSGDGEDDPKPQKESAPKSLGDSLLEFARTGRVTEGFVRHDKWNFKKVGKDYVASSGDIEIHIENGEKVALYDDGEPVVRDPAKNVKGLEGLKKLGIQLAIDYMRQGRRESIGETKAS